MKTLALVTASMLLLAYLGLSAVRTAERINHTRAAQEAALGL